MKVKFYSYRFAKEILEHRDHITAWREIKKAVSATPLFTYEGKSARNDQLDVVQQLLNVYYERRFSVDGDWEYHPAATNIPSSNLAADFRKAFGNLVIQMEVQFGNMSRWYSDIFKFQTAYSQGLIHLGVCVVPTSSLAARIDSNVTNYERIVRELPSAQLSITLPILVIGIEPAKGTHTADVRQCQYPDIRSITGQGRASERWRIVNGYLAGTPMADISPVSPLGPTISAALAPDIDD